MSLDISQYTIEPPIGEWPEGLPDHLSPAQITMFRRCPEQYRHRYALGEKERPAEAPVVGSAVHAGVERNYKAKIHSFEDVPTHELLEWFTDEGWNAVLAAEEEKGGEEVIWKSDPESAMTRARKMLGEYRNAVCPRVQPLSVEGMVKVDFGAPVPVIGRYDTEIAAGVIDLKTGARKQTKPKEGWRIQAAVYGEATGKPVEFHSLTATESRTVSIATPLEHPALLLAPTARERAALRMNVLAVAYEIAACMERYGPDEPWPTYGRFSEWACDWCGWRSICPAWSNEERQR